MRTLAAVLLIVGVAAGLRFSTLGQQSYWFDESTTVNIVSRDLGDALSAIPKTETSPPLYYLVAWPWAKLFGTGEAALRSLSALFGTATILVAFAAGKRVAETRAGIITAALIAVNPLLIWYSQEARAYALFVFLAALSFLCFLRVLAAPTPKNAAGWAATSCLAIATHYFGVFIVAGEALWLSTLAWRRAASESTADSDPRARREGTALLAALAAIVATSGGLVPLVLRQLPNSTVFSGRPLPGRIVRIPIQFMVGLNVSAVQITCLVVIWLVLTYVAFVLVRGGERVASSHVRAPAYVGLFAIAVPVALVAVGLDYVGTRNVLAALLPLAVVTAAGIVRMPHPRSAIVTVTLCLLFLAVTINVLRDPTLQRTDFRGVSRALGQQTGDRAIVATLGGDYALGVYLPRIRLLSESGADVREIDLIGLGSHNGSNRGVVRPPAELRPPDGFHEVEREQRETYSLVRLRSGRATHFSAAALFALALPGRESTVLLQATRSTRGS